VGLVKTSNLK